MRRGSSSRGGRPRVFDFVADKGFLGCSGTLLRGSCDKDPLKGSRKGLFVGFRVFLGFGVSGLGHPGLW